MSSPPAAPPLETVLGSADVVAASRIAGVGPDGTLPLTRELLTDAPERQRFGLTQNVGMLTPRSAVPSTSSSARPAASGAEGRPIALGYHTGHWEIELLVRERRRL
jgi:hypothetical protein